MGYTFRERLRINRKARKMVGIKSDAGDRYTFMEMCVAEMIDEGSDPEEAQSVCELLYEEGDTAEFD